MKFVCDDQGGRRMPTTIAELEKHVKELNQMLTERVE
jgi:hypothetical protein